MNGDRQMEAEEGNGKGRSRHMQVQVDVGERAVACGTSAGAGAGTRQEQTARTHAQTHTHALAHPPTHTNTATPTHARKLATHSLTHAHTGTHPHSARDKSGVEFNNFMTVCFAEPSFCWAFWGSHLQLYCIQSRVLMCAVLFNALLVIVCFGHFYGLFCGGFPDTLCHSPLSLGLHMTKHDGVWAGAMWRKEYRLACTTYSLSGSILVKLSDRHCG